MLRLKKLKQEKDAAVAAKKAGNVEVVTSPGELRIQKEVGEIDTVCGKDKTIAVSFPDPDNLMAFNVTIQPAEGYWKGGKFVFSVKVLKTYPHDAPKCHCDTKVYHPNIDLDGNVCLNILRDDWKPIMNLNQVILGLQFLFMDPNPDDPLNKEAAVVLRADEHKFQRNVSAAMRGGHVAGTYFAPCLAVSSRPGMKRGYDDY